MDLKIISCTDREHSESLDVSRYISTLYNKLGINPDVVSLRDFPLKDVVGGPYGKDIKSVIDFRKPILAADALLFVIPEYNGSFPGILKLFIDHLPFPEAFEKMPIAYVGVAAGSFGALRAVEQFQMVANYRNALQFPERVFISRVNKEFDENTGLKNDFQQGLLLSQTENFIKFVEALKS